MAIKFLDLRDRTGRQSSIGLADGKGTGPPGVEIIGVLPHMTAFSFEEFDRFARSYLEARGYSMTAPGGDDSGPVAFIVGNEYTGEHLAVLGSLAEAEEYLAGVARDIDPAGVDAGHYFIDGPCDVLAGGARGESEKCIS